MALKFAIAGLAALAGIAAAGTASAAAPDGNIENVRLVCDVYGRCWNRPNFYYGPRYYGGGYYPRPRFYGGYGPRFYGGGWRRW